MKTKLIILVGCVALLGCTNDQAYWEKRRALIAQLPPSQRAAAEIELTREEHAESVARRQAVGLAIAKGFSDAGDSIQQSNPPGSAGNPIYIQQPFQPTPIQTPPSMQPILIPTGY